MPASLESAVDRLLDLVLPYTRDQERVVLHQGFLLLWTSHELEWI